MQWRGWKERRMKNREGGGRRQGREGGGREERKRKAKKEAETKGKEGFVCTEEGRA